MKSRWSLPALLVLSLLVLPLPGCRSEGEEETSEREARGRERAVEPVFAAVTDEMLGEAASVAVEDWLVHGGSYSNQRYSALNQITKENVADLVPVWIYQTGLSESFATTPIVVGNVMYVTTPESHVVAMNAATGARLWEFTPFLRTTMLCCGPDNRGVAVYDDKVYVATLDARLIALNNRTGEVVWEAEVADPEDGYSQTMAPLAYGGKIFVGVGGSEYGIRGFVAAFDARTGREVWRWYTIPSPDEAPNGWWGAWRDTDPFGTALQRDIPHEQEIAPRYRETWKRGGGAVATTPAYDPDTRTLYLVVGNPAPSLDGVVRPGDNLYTGSIVALDGERGTLKWYFQYLPHDVWDLSGGSPPFLFDGGRRKYLGHAGKTGWLYIIDAATGRPVLRSENFVPQEGLFTRPTEEGVRMLPGANGGSSSPVAYSPKTGLAYVLGLHQPMAFKRAFQPWQKGLIWVGGAFRYIPEEKQWGILSAVDLKTGEVRWQRQVPAPMVGGAVVTSGGVLFVGQGNGSFDAFDAETGELLWQFQTGAGVNGGPITYMLDGVQYVAVPAGGNYHIDTPRGDALIVFALHGEHHTPLRGYPEPRYQRGSAVRYGAARQVPAAQVEQQKMRQSSRGRPRR